MINSDLTSDDAIISFVKFSYKLSQGIEIHEQNDFKTFF